MRDHPLLRQYSIAVGFRLKQTKKGKRAYDLPGKRDEDRSALVTEMARLVAEEEFEFEDDIYVSFVNQVPPMEMQNLTPRDRCVLAKHYPSLARYCSTVRIRNIGHVVPMFNSNLDGGWIGDPIETVKARIDDKVNRLPDYKANVVAEEFWLLICNGNDTIPSTLSMEPSPDAMFGRIADLARTLNAANCGGYDHIYWLVDAFADSGGESGVRQLV